MSETYCDTLQESAVSNFPPVIHHGLVLRMFVEYHCLYLSSNFHIYTRNHPSRKNQSQRPPEAKPIKRFSKHQDIQSMSNQGSRSRPTRELSTTQRVVDMRSPAERAHTPQRQPLTSNQHEEYHQLLLRRGETVCLLFVSPIRFTEDDLERYRLERVVRTWMRLRRVRDSRAELMERIVCVVW
jgi:hypothetical protein